MAVNLPSSSLLLPFFLFLIFITVNGQHFTIPESTIEEIQQAFAENKLTSTQLVDFYINQIKTINPLLHGIIEVNPDARDQAKNADEERRENRGRRSLGDLHGIPVLLKDTIGTKDKLNTSAGSYALVGSVVARDASVVEKLRKAGAVIMGKASLSEWYKFRSLSHVPNGWCARSGQGVASYQAGSDAIGVWPQFVMNNNEQFEHHQPPYKRPRNSEDNPNQSMNSRTPPTNNLPVHKGTTNIFFKTRVCAKFKTGTCRNGENCNFAHGMQDLRQPPPNWKELVGVSVSSEEDRSTATNWEDDQRIIHKMKLCKKFYNGEECPYGDRCNFLHEDPSKFREDTGRFRESSAISIGTTGQALGHGSGVFNAAEVNRPANNAVSDASRSNIIKPVYWKTKLCTKWEITGQCPFGEKCHFAHGLAELQAPSGRTEVEAGNAGSVLTKAPPPLLPNNVSPSMTVNVPSLIEEEQGKKCLLKWKGQKKINRIYADWLDDLPLVHNLTNQVQS